MNRFATHSLTLMVVAGCGTALLIWLAPASTIVHLILGLLLVLILPGYALTELLFAKGQLTRTERLLYTLGGSVMVATLGALLLNQVPGGVQTNGWIGLLVGVTLIGTLLGALKGQPATTTAAPRLPRLRISFNQLLVLAIAVGVAGIAVKTAQTPTSPQGLTGYTLLWMLPADDTSRLALGISNQEFAPTAYKLQVKVDDQLAQEWPSLLLGVNGRWAAELAVPATAVAGHEITAELYRLDQPDQLYRHVVLRPAVE